jgi:urease subunit gamma
MELTPRVRPALEVALTTNQLSRNEMELTSRKRALLIFTADCWPSAARPGLKLNYPEAPGTDQRRRHGRRPRWQDRGADDEGRTILSRADVMDGIAEMIPDIQVEATFPTAPLVTVHQPV